MKIFHLPWERMRCGLFTIEDLLPRQLWRDLRFSTNILIPVFLETCYIPRILFQERSLNPPTRARRHHPQEIERWQASEFCLGINWRVHLLLSQPGVVVHLILADWDTQTVTERHLFFPLFLSELLDVLFPLLVDKIVQLQIVKTLFASANHLCRCSWCCQSCLFSAHP